ncbi:MAG: hypothetical protein ACJA2Q_002238 [Pseudohongiellaceae bacterium]|jgi:hypothetical protein
MLVGSPCKEPLAKDLRFYITDSTKCKGANSITLVQGSSHKFLESLVFLNSSYGYFASYKRIDCLELCFNFNRLHFSK